MNPVWYIVFYALVIGAVCFGIVKALPETPPNKNAVKAEYVKRRYATYFLTGVICLSILVVVLFTLLGLLMMLMDAQL